MVTGGAHLTWTLRIHENLSGLHDIQLIQTELAGVDILPMTSLLGKPLGTGSYDLIMSQINHPFLSYATIPSYRGVVGITISNLDGN